MVYPYQVSSLSDLKWPSSGGILDLDFFKFFTFHLSLFGLAKSPVQIGLKVAKIAHKVAKSKYLSHIQIESQFSINSLFNNV